jgi:hypothetical protein
MLRGAWIQVRSPSLYPADDACRCAASASLADDFCQHAEPASAKLAASFLVRYVGKS